MNLLLHFEEQPGQRLLVNHRIAPTGIGGHIVYILDENEVGIHLVQVLNQRSVTGRTEQKRTVAVPERRIVRIHGYRIGRAFLYRHGDIVLHTEPLAVLRKRGIEHSAEIAGMFGRYGKMHRHPAPARRILRPLGQVLFQSRAHFGGIAVEKYQRLGHVSVPESAGPYDTADDILRRSSGGQKPPQTVVKRESLQRTEYLGSHPVLLPGGEIPEQLPEHPRRRTRSRHELHHAAYAAGPVVTTPQSSQPAVVETENTVAHGGGTHHIKIRKSLSKTDKLRFHRFRVDTVSLHALPIASIQHIPSC